MFQLQKPKQPEENAIIVQNVSKHFRIPHEKKTTLFEHIAGAIKGGASAYEEFWALRDVSFRVKKGETLGIIGENGSGKSTLLKIIAGVLTPDSGNVKVNGRIAPFLELGVGFNPELTAEDNVRLYGAIMGMTKKEMEDKFEEIFEFAELGRFRNMKLKNFSSGMYARLAFATAIATNPEVLLIDEVLAVGDVAFQKKCYGKINEFMRNGKTIVLVSHSLASVKQLCKCSVLLNKGKIESINNTDKVLNDYHLIMQKNEETNLQRLHKKTLEQIIIKENVIEQQQSALNVRNKNDERSIERWGSKEIEIINVQFYNTHYEEKYIFQTGEKIIIRIKFIATEPIENPVFGVAIFRDDGVYCYGSNTKIDNFIINQVNGKGMIEFSYEKMILLTGTYRISVAVFDSSAIKPFDFHNQAYIFKITTDKEDHGLLILDHEWKIFVKDD